MGTARIFCDWISCGSARGDGLLGYSADVLRLGIAGIRAVGHCTEGEENMDFAKASNAESRTRV